MLQTLKLNNKKQKKSLFYEKKSLVGLTPGNCQTVLPKEIKSLFKNRRKIFLHFEQAIATVKLGYNNQGYRSY